MGGEALAAAVAEAKNGMWRLPSPPPSPRQASPKEDPDLVPESLPEPPSDETIDGKGACGHNVAKLSDANGDISPRPGQAMFVDSVYVCQSALLGKQAEAKST